jgi:hypothetical protein
MPRPVRSSEEGTLVTKTRVGVIVGTASLLAISMVMALTPAGAAPSRMVRGVIGADVEGVGGLTEGGDWGAVASIGRGASTRLSDTDVTVDAEIPDAVTGTVEVSDSSEHRCGGTWRLPTAPPDTVCIYIANADNAVDIHGVSISPGAAGVKWGFKLVWSQAAVGEDSFVDATWAYNRG